MRRFIAAFVVTLVGLVAATVALLMTVDPYGIYDVAPETTLWRNKPLQRFHDRMVKAHLVRRLRPDLVMLGTSRTQVGLDPASPELYEHARRPANLALSGGTLYEARRYLEHAQTVGPVRTAIVGLDFTAFGERIDNPEFSEGRLAMSASGEPQRTFGFHDVGATLLSLDALRDAWRTLRSQAQPSYFLPSGRRDPTTLAERTREQGGLRAAFLEVEEEHALTYTGAAFDAPLTHDLAELDKLLRFAEAHHIAVRLFISPSHARTTLIIDAMGLRERYVSWKRDIVRLASRSVGDVTVWDFSGADPRFTAEPVPSGGDSASTMSWYWEGAHYKHELGDLVLACLLNDTCFFGQPLTETRFDAAMRDINDELKTYTTLHPDEALELGALAEDALLQDAQDRFAVESRD